jgi:DNA-binding transcriptional ArsR family regulator
MLQHHQLLGTLANKNCLRIIAALEEGERNVTEIATKTALPQTCTSHCLARLERDGLASARREGKFRIYSVNKKTVAQLATVLDEHNTRIRTQTKSTKRKWRNTP